MPLQDFYNTGQTTSVGVYSSFWRSQEFLAGSSYTLTSVKLFLFRSNSPGTITVSIRATDVDGKPTGGDIDSVTGTTDGDTLTGDSGGEWREIALSAGISITSGVQYAIVIRATSGNSSNKVNWKQDGSPPYYADGKSGSSSNSGSSWGAFDQSYMFETWSSANYVDASGTCAGVSDGSGTLEIENFEDMTGTCAGAGAGSGAMVVAGVPSDKVTYKRLVAIGNNEFWYEDI